MSEALEFVKEKEFYGRCNTCRKDVHEGDYWEQVMGMESWILFCSTKCHNTFREFMEYMNG